MDAPATVTPRAATAASEISPVATLLRRFFPVYCVLAALVTFGYALYDAYQVDGDAIAYMDIGDYLRAHQWAGIINGYWHPMYPAFLSIGHILFHSTRANELHAYYMVNFAIFLLEMVAIVCFTDSLVRLRSTLANTLTTDNGQLTTFLLDRTTFRYLGLALLVIASQRELSLGKIRPDALLQAFILFALAALLTHLATGLRRYAALMGLALGCAYLTKSFAFLFAFLCIATLAVFRWIWLKHSLARVIPAALIALVCFGVIAGPYVAALSRQHGRLDFGDSGSLNYAWYVGHTEKMHLQPYMTSQFGNADVHLKHPERELLHSPPIFSYAALPYGTYPDWFDTTYFNDQIKPHFSLRDDFPRAARNCVLVIRYLFNHPEALILLASFVVLGARLTLRWKPGSNAFWLPPVLLGLLIWGIYAIVNTEERYVTVAYISIILGLFATLGIPDEQSSFWRSQNLSIGPSLRLIASAAIFLLALLTVGESLRTVLEDRRQLSIRSQHAGWYSPTIFHVADSLQSLGVRPGDTVACIGANACLNDFYWARLAGVRILTEIYTAETPVYPFLAAIPNWAEAIETVRSQHPSVLVGDFGQFPPTPDPTFRDWQRLDTTTFYALPIK